MEKINNKSGKYINRSYYTWITQVQETSPIKRWNNSSTIKIIKMKYKGLTISLWESQSNNNNDVINKDKTKKLNSYIFYELDENICINNIIRTLM